MPRGVDHLKFKIIEDERLAARQQLRPLERNDQMSYPRLESIGLGSRHGVRNAAKIEKLSKPLELGKALLLIPTDEFGIIPVVNKNLGAAGACQAAGEPHMIGVGVGNDHPANVRQAPPPPDGCRLRYMPCCQAC